MKTTNKKWYKSMEKEENMGERSHLFEIRRLPRSAHAGNLGNQIAKPTTLENAQF